MKKNKNNNHIIIVIIILIIIGSIFIKYGLDFEKNATPIYSYTAQKSNDYEVLLKPNIFYENKTLPSGRYYTSNSINAYIINFKYDFKANKKTQIQYDYNITANLIGTVKSNDNEDKEVWNRNFILYDNGNNNQDNIDEICIDKQINIDYEYYNNLARSYEKNYAITIDAVLKIYFNISYTINLNSLGVENEQVEDFIQLDIPITTTISQVKENGTDTITKDINPKIERSKLYRDIFYIIGGVFIIVAIALIIIKVNNSKKTPEKKYKNKLKHISRYYSDLLVTITNKPDLSNLKIMNISTLDDLIDMAEQTQNNIIYYKDIENNISEFYVIINEYVYIYKLTLDNYK